MTGLPLDEQKQRPRGNVSPLSAFIIKSDERSATRLPFSPTLDAIGVHTDPTNRLFATGSRSNAIAIWNTHTSLPASVVSFPESSHLPLSSTASEPHSLSSTPSPPSSPPSSQTADPPTATPPDVTPSLPLLRWRPDPSLTTPPILLAIYRSTCYFISGEATPTSLPNVDETTPALPPFRIIRTIIPALARHTSSGPSNPIASATWSPSGHQFALAFTDSTIGIYNLSVSLTMPSPSVSTEGPSSSASTSSTSSTSSSSHSPLSLSCSLAATMRPLGQLPPDHSTLLPSSNPPSLDDPSVAKPSALSVVSYSPCGCMLAVGTSLGAVAVFAIPSPPSPSTPSPSLTCGCKEKAGPSRPSIGRLVTFYGHDSPIVDIAWSPFQYSPLILSSSSAIQSPSLSSPPNDLAALSPRYLTALSRDGVVRLWRCQDWTVLKRFHSVSSSSSSSSSLSSSSSASTPSSISSFPDIQYPLIRTTPATEGVSTSSGAVALRLHKSGDYIAVACAGVTVDVASPTSPSLNHDSLHTMKKKSSRSTHAHSSLASPTSPSPTTLPNLLSASTETTSSIIPMNLPRTSLTRGRSGTTPVAANNLTTEASFRLESSPSPPSSTTISNTSSSSPTTHPTGSPRTPRSRLALESVFPSPITNNPLSTQPSPSASPPSPISSTSSIPTTTLQSQQQQQQTGLMGSVLLISSHIPSSTSTDISSSLPSASLITRHSPPSSPPTLAHSAINTPSPSKSTLVSALFSSLSLRADGSSTTSPSSSSSTTSSSYVPPIFEAPASPQEVARVIPSPLHRSRLHLSATNPPDLPLPSATLSSSSPSSLPCSSSSGPSPTRSLQCVGNACVVIINVESLSVTHSITSPRHTLIHYPETPLASSSSPSIRHVAPHASDLRWRCCVEWVYPSSSIPSPPLPTPVVTPSTLLSHQSSIPNTSSAPSILPLPLDTSHQRYRDPCHLVVSCGCCLWQYTCEMVHEHLS